VLESYAVPAAAKPGENVTFHCLVDQDILSPATAFCQWSRPGGVVVPGAYPADEFAFVQYPDGSPESKRRCDFVLREARVEHHGVWQCRPSLVSGPVDDAGVQPFKFVVAGRLYLLRAQITSCHQ
jgi:hypothetical protein